jgi:hypothetical protein
MENTQAKAPSFPTEYSFVEKGVNILDYMRIPEENPPEDLEKLFLTFFKGFKKWLENDRRSTIKETIRELASLGFLAVATPIDPLTTTVVQPVVLPGPIHIGIPPAPAVIPTPEPPTPERTEAPEPVEEKPVDPLEESHPVPMEPDPRLAQPLELPLPPPPEKAAKGKKKPAAEKGKKKQKTAAEKEHDKQLYRIRKAFQQKNYNLRQQGKPEIPEPVSPTPGVSCWEVLLNQKEKKQEPDAPPSGSEDG